MSGSPLSAPLPRGSRRGSVLMSASGPKRTFTLVQQDAPGSEVVVYVAPPLEWVLFGVNLGCLGLIACIMLYFERQYPKTWALIGYPSMLFSSPTILRIGNWLPIMAILLGLGVFFRQSWSLPDDPTLTLMLWTWRILFITLCAFMHLLGG